VAKRVAALALALVLTLAMVFFFGYRAGRQARLLRFANSPIRPWMSVPFIAHTHHVPVATLFDAIHVVPHPAPDRRPLRRIAREEKRPVDELIHDINQAIAKTRGSPAPPPQNPDKAH
jgi:hypothetical protein